MTSHEKPKPISTVKRESRVAEALRENLRKRKAQQLAQQQNQEQKEEKTCP